MDFIVGLLLLIGGGIIGFFAARHFYAQGAATSDNEAGIREQFQLASAQHLRESRLLLEAVQNQCEALRDQLDAFESSVAEPTQDDNEPKLAFFGDQASAYLRSQQQKDVRTKAVRDDQPLDYSGQGSGLFTGSKKQQSNAAE